MLEIIKDAFGTALRKPVTWAALIGVPALIACFGLLYVGTFADPYERMKDMPVAIINEDAGYTFDGESRNFGNELADAIMETDNVAWTREDKSLLDDGLETSGYFLAVIIPSDFSEHVAAGQTSNPEQANITFYKNARKNYTLSAMSSKIETALKDSVSSKIGEQYASAYLEGLRHAASGFGDAADGASTLSKGLSSAVDGSSEIAGNLSTLTSGATSLQSGLNTLASGLTALNSQNATLTDGSAQISSGIDQLNTGSATYLAALQAQESQIAVAYGGDPADAAPALKQQLAKALQDYATNVVVATKTGQDPSAVDSSAVQEAATALANASAQAGAYQALTAAESGYGDINAGISTLASSYSALDSGIDSYTTAVSKLASGAASAQSGASSLASGSSKLESGANTLTDGISEAKDGSGTLSSSLADGKRTIDDALTASTDDIASYITDPVSVEDETYGDLDKFGYGFAPLFMSLGLWLGSLLIFFVFDVFPSREHLGRSRFAVIFGRWPLFTVLAAINATVICAGALALGVPCTDFGMFVALFAVDAFTFMCIMQLLNMFGIVGKAVAMLLVILQIVCCSGTIPAQLGTDFALAVGPALPFYYSIDAFREILSGGMMNVALADMGMILLYAAGAIALSLVLYPAGLSMKRKMDAKTVEAITGKTI